MTYSTRFETRPEAIGVITSFKPSLVHGAWWVWKFQEAGQPRYAVVEAGEPLAPTLETGHLVITAERVQAIIKDLRLSYDIGDPRFHPDHYIDRIPTREEETYPEANATF